MFQRIAQVFNAGGSKHDTSGNNNAHVASSSSNAASQSNWTTTSSGEVQLSDIRIYHNEADECVDLQCDNGAAHGIVFGGKVGNAPSLLSTSSSTEFSSSNNIPPPPPTQHQYTVVTSIVEYPNGANSKILAKISEGDVLVAINGRTVLADEHGDIMDLLAMLKIGTLPLRLKFLTNPNKLGISQVIGKYEERLNLQTKSQTQTDSYGFTRTVEYLQVEKAQMALCAEMYAGRDRDWVEYLKSIGGPDNLKPVGIFKSNKQLKQLCRRGIPVAFRPLVWMRISLASVYKQKFPQNHYQRLLSQSMECLDKGVADDIEKDVDRTFPDHDYFNTGKGCANLRRVLRAFAMQKPDIGYCQSLNFIVGMMLLFMEEEDAFWLLLTIVETLLPKDYYSKSMVGTYVDQYVLADIVKKNLPRVHSTFEIAQVQLPIVTVQWFMCLFVNTLRPEIALRVWDMFLNEGSKVLFRIAEALFSLNETKIVQAISLSDGSGTGELFKLLRDIGATVTDPEILITTAYPSYRPVFSTASISSSSATSSPVRAPFRSLSAKGSFRGLPPELNGLGLAHLGPSLANLFSPEKRSESSAAASLNSTLSLSNQLPSLFVPSGGSALNSSNVDEQPLPAIGTVILLEADMSNKLLRQLNYSRAPSAPTTPSSPSASSQSSVSISSVAASHFSSASASSASSASPLSAFIQLFSMSGNSIKRADIQTMRCSYRPELEARFVMMEITRKQHHDEHCEKVDGTIALSAIAADFDFDDDESSAHSSVDMDNYDDGITPISDGNDFVPELDRSTLFEMTGELENDIETALADAPPLSTTETSTEVESYSLDNNSDSIQPCEEVYCDEINMAEETVSMNANTCDATDSIVA